MTDKALEEDIRRLVKEASQGNRISRWIVGMIKEQKDEDLLEWLGTLISL